DSSLYPYTTLFRSCAFLPHILIYKGPPQKESPCVPSGERGKEQGTRRKEVNFVCPSGARGKAKGERRSTSKQASRCTVGVASRSQSRGGEGSEAGHRCQVKVFFPTLRLRVPSPLAGEGQGEGVYGSAT